MSETVLLQARCGAGHTWDVYGVDLGIEGQGPRVDRDDLECPSCPDHPLHGRPCAVELTYPESLA
jgi:hypothetical protein